MAAERKSSDAAMEGVRYVLHVASPIPSTMPKDPDDLIVPAREETLNVMRAASRASVQRVVQTSSSSAIFYGRDDPNPHLFTEANWTDPDHKDNVPLPTDEPGSMYDARHRLRERQSVGVA
jgi:dihydroflavonol-4-reductase